MAQVLYRKYRPQSFSEVKGQESIVPLLKQSVITNNLSHAYLFSGPRGCGKTSVARIMAKAVNCERFNEKNDVCNECTSCRSIDEGSALDVIEMDAASNRGVEEIRSLKDKINFLPSFLKYKVYIIDEAHMLTKEAFNALLKTLEEPPEHVIFILATTESNKLPVTILSRVIRFDFQFGSENEVIDKLKSITDKENIKIDDKSLEVIFKYSGGSFRDAESLLGKIILSNKENNITINLVSSILGIVSDENVSNILQLLLDSDIKGIRDQLKKIFSAESDQVLFIDQLLGYLKEEIYNNLSDSDKLKKLNIIANGLIKLKNDLKDFSDKKTIMEIGFIEIVGQLDLSLNSSKNKNLVSNNEIINTPINLERRDNIIPKLDTSNISKTSEQPGVKAIISKEGLSFTEYLIENSKQTIPRLVPIIKSSQVDITESSIVIKNKYSFNLSYLNKIEVKTHIKQISLAFFNKEMSITFEIGDVNNQFTKLDSDIVNPINTNNRNESQEETKSIDSQIVKKIEVLDNTDLVESILLS